MTTEPMKTIEVLRAARDLISDGRRWTQYEMARSKDGIAVGPDADEAVCFCAIGAVRHVAGSHVSVADSARAALLREIRGARLVSTFNDYHTHPEVLALFDRAISNAKRVSA